MSIQATLQQIAELEKKARLYDAQRGRYVEYAAKLRGVVEQLSALAEDLDPAIEEGAGTRRDWSMELRELHEKMLAGVQVSSGFLRAAYPDVSEPQVYYLMNRLRKMPGVAERKDGVALWLFRKEA